MTLGNIYALLWIFLLHKPFHPASFIPRRHKVVSGKHGGTGRRGLCPGGVGGKKKKFIPVSCDVDRQMLENRFASSTPADICLSPVFVPARIKCEKM